MTGAIMCQQTPDQQPFSLNLSLTSQHINVGVKALAVALFFCPIKWIFNFEPYFAADCLQVYISLIYFQMKKTIYICLIGLFGFSITPFSQTLEITYDAKSGNLKYMQGATQVTDPIVKKGQPVTLKVENYNNYLYDLEIKESHQDFHLGSDNNLLGNMQGFGFSQLLQGGGENLSGAFKIVPNFPIDMITGVPEILELGDSKKERLIIKLKRDAKEKIEILEGLQSEMVESEMAVDRFEKNEQFRSIALEEVKKIKYNAQLSTPKIKEHSEAILCKALNITPGSNCSISDVLKQGERDLAIKELIKDQESRLKKYNDNIENLKLIQTELRSLVPSNELIDLYFTMEKKIETAPKVANQSNQITASLQSLQSKYKEQDINAIMDIWYEYEAIHSNDFSKTYSSQAEGDIIVFDLKFNLKESAPETDAVQAIQLAPIKIPVYGGLKMNASVGVNFGQFFDRPKTYFVRDSTIIGQNGDSFLPMITSFMHFYSQGRSGVSFGGSLGLGIPIGGGQGCI